MGASAGRLDAAGDIALTGIGSELHVERRAPRPGGRSTRLGFITVMSPLTAMSPAFTSAGPVADSCSRLGPSPCICSAICFTFRTMSVTSSRTPASEENSCSTFSILIEVTAAP